MPPDKAAKRQGIVAAATRDRRKAEKQPPRAAEKAAKRQKQPPRAAKGFNLVCANILSLCVCALIRALQNLESSLKGFNCCGAKLPLRRAESRLAEPRSFPERNVFRAFCVVQKEPKSTPEVCEPLDSGNDSNRRSIRDFC